MLLFDADRRAYKVAWQRNKRRSVGIPLDCRVLPPSNLSHARSAAAAAVECLLSASSGDDSWEENEVPARAPRLTVEEKEKQFSREVLELMGSNDVQQTHILKVLAIASRFYDGVEGEPMPTTVWHLKKKAGYVASSSTAVHPVCVNDHAHSPGVTTCHCGLSLVTRWPRGIVVPDVAERVRRMFAQPDIAKAFLYATTREAGDGDVWDGELARTITAQKRAEIIYMMIASDATEFGTTKSANFMPILGLCVNFPPSMRSSFAALLLLGLLPAKVRWPLCLYYVTVFVCQSLSSFVLI